eukprot:gene17129-23433_t
MGTEVRGPNIKELSAKTLTMPKQGGKEQQGAFGQDPDPVQGDNHASKEVKGPNSEELSAKTLTMSKVNPRARRWQPHGQGGKEQQGAVGQDPDPVKGGSPTWARRYRELSAKIGTVQAG